MNSSEDVQFHWASCTIRHCKRSIREADALLVVVWSGRRKNTGSFLFPCEEKEGFLAFGHGVRWCPGLIFLEAPLLQ